MVGKSAKYVEPDSTEIRKEIGKWP